MTQRVRSGSRLALVLLVLAAVVFSQAAAVVLHEANQGTGHYCLICHAGPLPLVQASMPVPGAPAVSITWLAATPESPSVHDTLLPVASSRAPPAA